MLTSIDKNDVSLDKLFNWGNKFTLKDKQGNALVDVYVKLVGDADLNRAKVVALRESAKLRKELKTPNSDERVAYISDISVIEKNEMIETILLFRIRELTQDAIRDIKIPLKKEPDSDASLEEQELYQEFIDEYPSKREEEIRNYIEIRATNLREDLSKLSKEELYKLYEAKLIDQLCESRMLEYYKDELLYSSVFMDENFTQRAFSSLEKYKNLPQEIKNQIQMFYDSLEISGSELKKLLEATQ